MNKIAVADRADFAVAEKSGQSQRPQLFLNQTRVVVRLAEEPMDFLVRQMPPLLWQAREELARFLGGDPSRLLFTANVTASVNMVASALQLAAPGEILISGKRVTGPQTETGFIFSNPALLEWRTALSNVLLQAEVRGLRRQDRADPLGVTAARRTIDDREVDALVAHRVGLA